MTKTKTVLFVDGTNLYGSQYELFGPEAYLNFSQFLSTIEQVLGKKFQTIYFYASYSPTPKIPSEKQKKYLKNEALFYRSVKQVSSVVFFKGYRSPTSGKEKEVDVKLTADLVHLAHIDAYKEVFLLTGDADFLQALFIINSLRKKVQLLCLENKIMHKGMYHFQTSILHFSKKQFPSQRKTQLVTEFLLDKRKLVSKIL